MWIGWALIGLGVLDIVVAIAARIGVEITLRRPSGDGGERLVPNPPPPQGGPPAFQIGTNYGDIHYHAGGETLPDSGPSSSPPSERKSLVAATDYSASHFACKRIRITEFPLENGLLLRGKTFESCVIEGPAILLPHQHVEFAELTIRSASPGNLVWAIPAIDKPIDNVIVLESCAFRKSTFEKIGFAVPADRVEAIRDALTGRTQRLDI